jgi:Cdc6-like AAA superfamily ATPase
MEFDRKDIQLANLSKVFTPSAPVTASDFFVRRLGEIEEITESVAEPGQHAVLYGERGVGKTSLANFIDSVLSNAYNLVTVKISCNQSDNTGEIWNKIFKKISTKVENYEPNIHLSETDDINPSYIIEELEDLHEPTLIVIDEFDNIKKSITQTQIADTIKVLSDTIPYITILIVGVADSINDLIGSHPSLERCLKQIKLGRMLPQELQQIIEKGLEKLELTIDEEVKNDIIEFSQGFPHYVHLLAKSSAKVAIEKSTEKITRECFNMAVNEAIKNTQESIRKSYQEAITTTRNQDGFRNVLWACTLVEEDESGTFRAKDIEENLLKITNKKVQQQAYSYNLGMLCQNQKGAVLEKVGESSKQTRYRFKNPLLKAYIKLIIYQQKKETTNFLT